MSEQEKTRQVYLPAKWAPVFDEKIREARAAAYRHCAQEAARLAEAWPHLRAFDSYAKWCEAQAKAQEQG